MSSETVALVLAAATLHAGWNFLAKWSGGGPALAALTTAVSACLYGTVLLFVLPSDNALDGTLLTAAALSGALHAGYFLSLQRSYRTGDLSFVYPLTRGIGPLVALPAAILLLGERPTLAGLAGALLIIAAVLSLTRGIGTPRPTGANHAVVTGVFIAAYTLWDKHAVSALDLAPLLYLWAVNTGEALFICPLLWTHASQVKILWRERRAAVLAIAVASPAAYLLILLALKHAPVSFIAPAREVSVVIGAAMGGRMLSESQAHRRIVAAVMIVVGFAAIALG